MVDEEMEHELNDEGWRSIIGFREAKINDWLDLFPLFSNIVMYLYFSTGPIDSTGKTKNRDQNRSG